METPVRESGTSRRDVVDLPVDKAADQLLEECRMVLPGVQALFGFQLIVVFNAAFKELLTPREQGLHLAAMLLIVCAIALVMAPAAIHRVREPESVSRAFVRLSSRLLTWGMVPLALGTTLDVYLVAHALVRDHAIALFAASFSAAVFVGLWWTLPRLARLEARVDRRT